MKWRGGENIFYSGKKFGVLRHGEAAHQDRAGVDFFVSGFCGELGKEIHGTWFTLQ